MTNYPPHIDHFINFRKGNPKYTFYEKKSGNLKKEKKKDHQLILLRNSDKEYGIFIK